MNSVLNGHSLVHSTYCVFLCVLGADCIQFFVQKSTVACALEYLNNVSDHFAKRACVTIKNNAKADYYSQLIQEPVYTYETDPYSIIQLKGSPFDASSKTINTFITDGIYGPIDEFAVDWIQNNIYIILEKFMSGPMYNTSNEIPLNHVFSKNEDFIFGSNSSDKVSFLTVKLDPYRRFLFVLLHYRSSSLGPYYRVVRSNLSGKELKQIMTKSARTDSSIICLDVNEMRLLVSVKNDLYIYNYEGDFLREIKLPHSVTDFAVFENSVYLTSPEADGIIEVNLDQTQSPLAVTTVYRHDLGRELRITIVDARVLRQKKDGKYLCDRTDCPELCEVEPSGDTCVCFHTKAKARDGVMCYTCGQSDLTSLVQQPTIVNGQISHARDFPWHAILYKTTDGELVCGGTLISSRVVLTAAHCVTTFCFACTPSVLVAEDLRVALGKTNLSWNITEPHVTTRGVKRILVKEGYMGPSTNFANDIALLFLDSKVSINGHVMPACLDYNLNQLPDHGSLTGYVCGFGYTKDCGPSCSNFSDTLLHTTGTVVSTDDCLVALNLRDKSAFHTLTSDKFCIGNGTVSVVQSGDSGGGFTLTYRGLHYVTGVVSIKLLRYRGKVFKYSFGGFTNISMHMDWIKHNLGNSEEMFQRKLPFPPQEVLQVVFSDVNYIVGHKFNAKFGLRNPLVQLTWAPMA